MLQGFCYTKGVTNVTKIRPNRDFVTFCYAFCVTKIPVTRPKTPYFIEFGGFATGNFAAFLLRFCYVFVTFLLPLSLQFSASLSSLFLSLSLYLTLSLLFFCSLSLTLSFCLSLSRSITLTLSLSLYISPLSPLYLLLSCFFPTFRRSFIVLLDVFAIFSFLGLLFCYFSLSLYIHPSV